ncbi:thioredoxin [Geothrix campi]|jgi:thioredoxin 1|uniref:thioredoxin n=1 Tax=Geothrix campi TaxID=2966450 RepID=UPI002147593E|nr:thioredoxin [Geothrix sp. SG10]
MSEVIHLTTEAFHKVSSHDTPVLIDFWAPWCGPCRMQGPILDEVAKTGGVKAVVAKVNVDEEPLLAGQFGVQSIPTIIVLKGGRIQSRMVGVQPAHALLAALQQAGA